MSNGYRTLSQHLNDLKKENFSLKLRIYFLEERIQQKYEESSEDVYRSNIELKVEVESLKQELQEKQQLLDKALTTAESLTNNNEAELQRRCQEQQQEIDHMQQVLETKIQLLQEEAQLARSKAERMASLAGSHSHASILPLDTTTEDIPEDIPEDLRSPASTNKDRVIEELTKELRSKEELISELKGERTTLTLRVGELEGQVQELSSSLLQKDKDVEFYQEELGQERLRIEQEMQNLVAEQQSQLNQYECAAGQCVSELQKAQLHVRSLQAKFHESEANNLKLQEKLNEMERELRSLRQSAQSHERTIQGLMESISTKDGEAQELYQLIEGQNSSLCKLREMVHRSQHVQSQTPEGVGESSTLAQLQGELVGVQSSLFSLGLELEASQRSLRQSHRHNDDLLRFKDRLNSDLQEALQHREVTEKHNQELRCALQKVRSILQVKESALKESEAERLAVLKDKDRSVTQLRISLQDKEQQLQEYSEMVESSGSYKTRDALLEKLRERIKDRDRALERSIDEKFRCLDEREGQVRKLQLALREKERDMERLRCILSNNEETITSLDALVRSKDLELEQAAEAYRNLQWLKQQSEEKERNTLREKDTIVSQLQAALQACSQETKDLTAALLARVHAGPSEVVEELKARLDLKERLFQELLSDRSRQFNEHQTQVHDLLNTLSSKDQYLQDNSYRLSMVISERTVQLQELRRQLSLREQELCELRRDKDRDTGAETEHLRSLLREKEMMQPRDSEAEVKTLQEELQLMLKKEREAQTELSALRSSLAKGVDAADLSDHQGVLEQLISEHQRLNEALRVEKRLYQSLTHIHTTSDSSGFEKIQALHTELDSVQALRGQLEEVLARAQNLALVLQRAAKRQPDFGELRSEEEEEGEDEDSSSSDEFTDSIEEDGNVTSRRVASNQPESVCGQEPVCGGLLSADQGKDIQQLEEADTLEWQLKEVRSQRERDELPSVAQTRSDLQTLQQEDAREPRTHTGDDHSRQEDDEEEGEETSSASVGAHPSFSQTEERGRRRCTRCVDPSHPDTQEEPADDSSEVDVEEGLHERAARLRCDLAVSHQENRELQERLMVSEATVHAQAEQLKDYRDLLTETSVQQASKQVQVDLQDLGYETCGRSENEAEREDTSSPEFDDLEMCTSLSHQQEYEGVCVGGSWYSANCTSHQGAYEEEGDESASLHHVVQDLRSQLTRCHKVIRSLQLRVRSLSATSDYASSLERTPRKVNWAFEMSPAASGVEEDEGWMSDTQGIRSGSQPSRELRELMARVASLEAQLKSSTLEGKAPAEEGKCATWPGKYNSLIQAQARELSHLRQRMREGQGVSHILTQHLGDTTKAFEELLRANDIDYYMGQSFREQLAQSSALAQRVVTKICGREKTETHEKTGHELLALRLSKELQQKDQIIESLHTKLQHRPETPSSCQALSETTDQSDRTSLVSDEYRTHEDVELSSDLDAREYQEDHGPLQPGPQQDGFAASHGQPRFTISPGAHSQHDLPSYSQLSHHGVLGHSLKSDSGFVTGGTLWDMDNMTQPASYSGQQLERNLMEEHLHEVRRLRQRLEESIRTNERLRQQMEERLNNVGREGGAPTNIYIQGLDSVTQLSNDLRLLKEENLSLHTRLQASTDTSEEVAQLREAEITARACLSQAELEAEQWKEELRRLQAHSQEQGQQIHSLRQERLATQEKTNRLQHEVCLLQQQLCESRELVHSLQTELHVYDRVCSSIKSTKGYLCELPGLPGELGELLGEVRSLRAQLQNNIQENSALKQLEQKLGVVSLRTPSFSALSASPQKENSYRRQLLHDPAPSPPVRDIGLFNCGSPGLLYSDLEDTHSTANDPLDPHAELEGEAPDGSFANRNGRHAIGHVDDYGALQQQVVEGRSLVQRMEAALQACLGPTPQDGGQEHAREMFLDDSCAKSLLANTKTLKQILEESMALLRMFWRAALPGSDPSGQHLKKERCMQEEILSLKLRVSEQEEVLKGTIQRLRSTSRTKENMENFIVNQLSRTRDVLKKARMNLEKNELRLSSLSSSPSCPHAAQEPGAAADQRPSDRRVLTTAAAAGGRSSPRKRSSRCLL